MRKWIKSLFIGEFHEVLQTPGTSYVFYVPSLIERIWEWAITYEEETL